MHYPTILVTKIYQELNYQMNDGLWSGNPECFLFYKLACNCDRRMFVIIDFTAIFITWMQNYFRTKLMALYLSL